MLGDLREAVRRDELPQAHEAVVVDAPGSVSAGLRVRLPSFDDGRSVSEPCPWTPRVAGSPPAIVMPEEGDRALAVVSDEGELWVVAYWPAGYD